MGSSGRGQARAQEEAGRITANAATNAGNLQSQNALAAAELEAEAILRAGGVSAAGFGAASSGIGAGANRAIGHVTSGEESAISSIEGGRDRALIAQRESFDKTRELLDPFTRVGDESLIAIEQGASAEGFANRLSSIMNTDIYRSVVDERFQQADARYSQAGLNRSGAAGTNAARITTETALGLDSELYQRQLNNVNIDLQASNSLSAFGQQNADSISGIETRAGEQVGGINFAAGQDRGRITLDAARAQGAARSAAANAQANAIVGSAGARANGLRESAFHQASGHTGSANALANGNINAADARAQARSNRTANILGAANTAASLLFASDPRLKKNMKKIGKIGRLDWFEWDWLDSVKNMIGTEMTTGFNADQVQKEFPDCVLEVGGIKVVDYPKVHKYLETELAS